MSWRETPQAIVLDKWPPALHPLRREAHRKKLPRISAHTATNLQTTGPGAGDSATECGGIQIKSVES